MHKICKQKQYVYLSNMKKIFILTGEPSGDKLASKVISKLQKNPNHLETQKLYTSEIKCLSQ